MQYLSVNGFMEKLSSAYPMMSKVVLVFNYPSMKDTLYKNKQGTPCLIKVFNNDGDKTLKYDDIAKLFDDRFAMNIKIPKVDDDFFAIEINATSEFDEKQNIEYYKRRILTVGPKTLKVAKQEFEKMSQEEDDVFEI